VQGAFWFRGTTALVAHELARCSEDALAADAAAAVEAAR
jgi:hypothetical protein